MNRELIAKAMTRSFVRMPYLLLDSFYSMILPIRDHRQERCVLVPRQTKDNLVLSDLLVTRLNRGPQSADIASNSHKPTVAALSGQTAYQSIEYHP